MVDEDSKTNIVIIYTVIISAVVIGGLALWFFFDSISEREKDVPKENSDFPIEVEVSQKDQPILIPTLASAPFSARDCILGGVGEDFEKKIVVGTLTAEHVQGIIDACVKDGTTTFSEMNEFIPAIDSSSSKGERNVRYQIASPTEVISMLSEFFQTQVN